MSQTQDGDAQAMLLARHLAKAGIDRASTGGVDTARSAITDTIGVMIAGSKEPVVSVLRQTLTVERQPSEALLVGSSDRCGLLDAALINGTAAHAIDYDDMASAMGGHPSVLLVPVILALGEHLDRPGRDLIDAYIVGFEAMARIGRVVHPHHYDRGWHPTSTLGVFGAAASAARLLGLDVEQTATALALSASMASGVKANFGTMTKPFHAGHAARDGLMAALLVLNGFTANRGVLEHKQGFYAAYDGLDRVTAEKLLPTSLDAPLEIDGDGFGLKQFPCCGSTHPAILAALGIAGRDSLDPAAVDAIEIRTHSRRLPHTDNPQPTSALGAKFSIQYATVRALLSGAPRVAHFEGEAFREPEVDRLLARTSALPLKDAADVDDQFTAEVTVSLADGSVRFNRVSGALGRGPLNPMSKHEMWDKFSDCAGVALTHAGARQVFETLMRLEDVESARQLSDELVGGISVER